jgi:uncharacterized protein
MAKFFISYSRSDRPVLDNLVPQVRTVFGDDILWFDGGLRAGDKWWQTILTKISQCELFLFLLSDDAAESKYCQDELREALRLNKTVIPVIVRRLKSGYPGNTAPDLVDVLKSIHYEDLSSGLNNPIAINSLWGAINGQLKNREKDEASHQGNSDVNLEPKEVSKEDHDAIEALVEPIQNIESTTRTKLTRAERWMLSNQFGILAKLDPDQEDTWNQMRTVVESGYELHYDWFTSYIYDGDSIMSREECLEVLDILDMFTTLQHAFTNLTDKSGIDDMSMEFDGFDGNNETKYMAYTRFLIKEEGKFSQLDRSKETGRRFDFNSHFPVLPRYRLMLREWAKAKSKYDLSKEDIIRIASVRYPK